MDLSKKSFEISWMCLKSQRNDGDYKPKATTIHLKLTFVIFTQCCIDNIYPLLATIFTHNDMDDLKLI